MTRGILGGLFGERAARADIEISDLKGPLEMMRNQLSQIPGTELKVTAFSEVDKSDSVTVDATAKASLALSYRGQNVMRFELESVQYYSPISPNTVSTLAVKDIALSPKLKGIQAISVGDPIKSPRVLESMEAAVLAEKRRQETKAPLLKRIFGG